MIAEPLLFLLAVLLFGVFPIAVAFMAITAFARSRRVEEFERRIEHLETLVDQLASGRRSERGGDPGGEQADQSAGSVTQPEAFVQSPARSEPPVIARAAAAPTETGAPGRSVSSAEPIPWEMLIGKRALGWIAGVLLVFAAAFFIRYAVDNDWIGPLGQITLVEILAVALVVTGARLAHQRWRRFSQMVTAAGTVVLYLATYAAFGYYELLPRSAASAFLVIILVESALLALAYDSPAIGLTAVLGGLLIPVLMHSTHDQYGALFTYLAALNAAVVVLLLAKHWAAIGTVALLGTQALFWFWYTGNYHPEKLGWALGFQAVVYGLYLLHPLAIHWLPRHWLPRRRASAEDLVRMVLAPALGFAALYVLLRDDALLWQRAEPWMGAAALVVAMGYAAIARVMLAGGRRESDPISVALAISVGFIALAIPLQAEAAWVALGWAAVGAVLWWFGQRISAGRLRAIAGGLGVAAVVRLVVHDLPAGVREPFVPVFNDFALPAIGVAGCLLAAVALTRRFLPQRDRLERSVAGIAAGAGVLLLWLVLSVDTYDYFEMRAHQPEAHTAQWLWAGQLALSVFWAVYATAALVVGFRLRRPWLRWLALAMYGVTVLKVFFADMQQLDEIYRIGAFFVLAIFLGLAAWGYQRISPQAFGDEGNHVDE